MLPGGSPACPHPRREQGADGRPSLHEAHLQLLPACPLSPPTEGAWPYLPARPCSPRSSSVPFCSDSGFTASFLPPPTLPHPLYLTKRARPSSACLLSPVHFPTLGLCSAAHLRRAPRGGPAFRPHRPPGEAPAAAPLRSGPVTSLPRFSSHLTLPLSSSPRAVRSKDVNFLTRSSLDNFSRSRSRECDSVCIFYLLRDASSLVPTSRSW